MEINRNIFNVGVIERDFDWSPFPSGPCETIEINESVHEGEADESVSTEKNMDEVLLEEGEIQDEAIGDAVIPTTMDMVPEPERLEAGVPMEDQQDSMRQSIAAAKRI